jgi:protein-S-isoprenylcysteine O-methyltransferase Ste14
MKTLFAKAIAGLAALLVVLAALSFLFAWTIHFWQAWACLATFFLCAAAITAYLMIQDPALLERRMRAGAKAEREKNQKVIQSLSRTVFLALFVVPALDHRFAWSRVPAAASIAGDVLIVIGFAVVFAVFRANTYTSGIIEVAAEQTVISTGPYAYVRHPMYSGVLILLFGIPIALGSWWSLLLFVPIAATIVWRLLDEEKFLAANLTGYANYLRKVKYRLVPMVW